MADFSNKQLAEIITQTADSIQANVLKQRKIANDLNSTDKSIEQSILELDSKIKQLQLTPIKADLSSLNQFYEEKTAENVKRLNSRLQVPNLALFIWISSVIMFSCSGLFIWFSVKSKRDIITEYQTELLKDKKLITNGENQLFNDMHIWFQKNPNTKASFIQWREKKK